MPTPTRPEAPTSRPKLDMMTFLATEGGRKCPNCGRYAKPEQLGWVGLHGPGIIVDAYGHLPGFGCNRRDIQTKKA
jgi:hypothetical protein